MEAALWGNPADVEPWFLLRLHVFCPDDREIYGRDTISVCQPSAPTQISFLVLVCGLRKESRIAGMRCLCCRCWAWLWLAVMSGQSARSHSSRCVHMETHSSDLNTHSAVTAKTDPKLRRDEICSKIKNKKKTHQRCTRTCQLLCCRGKKVFAQK